MKTVRPELVDYLATAKQLLIADLLEIKTSTGDTIYVTNSPLPLSVEFPGEPHGDGPPSPGFPWHARGTFFYDNSLLGFTRGKTAMRCGLQVDTLDLQIWPKNGFTYGGIPFIQALANGLFDGANAMLMRIYMPTWGDTSLGPVWLFSGQMTEIVLSRNTSKVTVKSTLQQLDKQMPRNVFQAPCLNTIYDAGCGVDASTYQVDGAATSGGDNYNVPFSDVTNPDTYFDQGTITATYGANTGAVRSIKAYAGSSVQVFKPFLYAPAPGDLFTLLPGCDGTLGANGCPKFSNTARFRGLPFIPIPETMQ